MAEFRNLAREASSSGLSVYIASVDIDSAFDNAPHANLVRAAEERGIDPSICRYIYTWLTSRMFSDRLTGSD